jgi:hypothetical protein
MGKKSAIVATGTLVGDGDITNPDRAGVLSNLRAQIEPGGTVDGAPRDLAVNLRAHLVAIAADGGPAVYQELTNGHASVLQDAHSPLYNATGRALPP